MKDAVHLVGAVRCNVLVDYGELYRFWKEVKTLIGNNDVLKSTLETMLDRFVNSSLRSKIFVIADALAGGSSTVISSGGGEVAAIPTLSFAGMAAGRTRRKRCIG